MSRQRVGSSRSTVAHTTDPAARARPTVAVLLRATVATIGVLAVLTGCGSDGDGPPTSAAGGPITVEQLLARSADTPIAVQGLLLIDQGSARLCAAILESFPPQCGEPSVELVGLDPSAVEGTTSAEGVTWKEGAVLRLQRAGDGRFEVVDVVAGFSVQSAPGLYSGAPDPTWNSRQSYSAAIRMVSRLGVASHCRRDLVGATACQFS